MYDGGSGARVVPVVLALTILAGCAAGGATRVAEPEPPADPTVRAEIANEAFRKAVSLSRDGRTAEAVPWYRRAAENGQTQAQFVLGSLYRTGRGVTKDPEAAAAWYRRAAAAGDTLSQFSLGSMYLKGEGVPPDVREAVRLFRLAADKGHRGAQYNLGALYYNGELIGRDYVAAERWFTLAGAQGDAWAQYALGRLYSLPHQGVGLNRVRAHAWFTLAAQNGHEQAAAAAAALEPEMSPAERASSRATVRRLAAQESRDDDGANTGM